MGALHEGHMALVKQGLQKCDVIVASIFVNPLQFNNPEDLKNYPRDEKADLEYLEKKGCHVVFIPTKEEFYPDQTSVLKIDFGSLALPLEGAHRPGHFSGVAVVLSKLFNCVSPSMAFFGKKDIQQLAVVRKLVHDLNVPVGIIGVETMRDQNGLALSSRNQLLTSEQREEASMIFKSLKELVEKISQGENLEEAKTSFLNVFRELPNFVPEYIEIVDEYTMQPIDSYEDSGSFAACTAVMMHGVRLIDNITFQ